MIYYYSQITRTQSYLIDWLYYCQITDKINYNFKEGRECSYFYAQVVYLIRSKYKIWHPRTHEMNKSQIDSTIPMYICILNLCYFSLIFFKYLFKNHPPTAFEREDIRQKGEGWGVYHSLFTMKNKLFLPLLSRTNRVRGLKISMQN